jgi:hypothetical protein
VQESNPFHNSSIFADAAPHHVGTCLKTKKKKKIWKPALTIRSGKPVILSVYQNKHRHDDVVQLISQSTVQIHLESCFCRVIIRLAKFHNSSIFADAAPHHAGTYLKIKKK